MSRFTIIVPVFNAAATLGACLEAIAAETGPDDEVIVVDDASTDASVEIASAYPVTLLRNPANLGVARSRNLAARAATGELLLFTDADATLRPGTLERARALLTGGGAPSAVVGVYAAECGPGNVVSRFKNLWIRYSYLRSARSIDWLFGCIFALPRGLFFENGGFDGGLDRRFGGSDVDLGLRLHRSGREIRLVQELEVIHLRRFTLASLLRNDRDRATGYSRLGLRALGWRRLLGRLRFANISVGFLAGMALLALIGGSAAAAGLGLVPPATPLAPSAAYLALNLRFYAYLGRQGGAGLALAGVILLALSQLACGAGSALGMLRSPARGKS